MRAILLGLIGLLLGMQGVAGPRGPVPDWLVDPPRSLVRLSPDGERLAWASGQRIYRAPVEAAAQAQEATAPGFVEGLWWIGNDRLLIHSSGAVEERLDMWSGETLGEIVALPREGRSRISVISARENRILFAADQRRAYAPDVYEVRAPLLRPVLAERNPGTVFGWLVDERGDLAAAHRWRPAGSGIRYEWLVRRGDRWQLVRGFELGDPEERVLRVADRGLLIARPEAGRSVLRWFDPLARRLEPPVWTGEAHILGVVDALASGAPGLVTVEAERRNLVSQGSYWPERVAALESAYSDHEPVLLGRGGADSALLWKLFSDQDPGCYVLQDATGELTPLFPAMAAASGPFHPMVPFRFAASDGLPLDGYVTGAGADRPAVVLVHGGPWARDSWQFHPEAQFLAGLGYAVLQVNFRGSNGFGSERLNAGRRQWGAAMQGDLLDGIAAAAQAGWIDASRVCVMGASYGGYAALMGVLQHPEVFWCAVSRAPVTDLPAFMERMRVSGNRRGYLEWREMVGPPGALRSVSPMTLAEDLDRPVLIAHGTRDEIVPVGHGERFAAVAEQTTFLPLDTDHRLLEPAARRAYYGAVANFLAEHLGRTSGE